MKPVSLALAVRPETHAAALPLLAVMARQGFTVELSVVHGDGDPLADMEQGGARLALLPVDALASPPAGIRWAAVPKRAEPRDVFVPAGGASATLWDLPAGSRVGVGGARRWSFLQAHRPDLDPVALVNGGGPDTALASGTVDAVVLGAGEARRILPDWRATEIMDHREWVPGACQGALVLLARADDEGACLAAVCVEEPSSRAALVAERSVVDGLGARPDAPLGVLALAHGRRIRLWGMVASADGRGVVRGDLTGPTDDPRRTGRSLADMLLARGAGELLKGSMR